MVAKSSNAKASSKPASRNGAVANDRPLAAPIEAYSASARPTAAPSMSSVSAALQINTNGLVDSASSLIEVLARLGMIELSPKLSEQVNSTDNVMEILRHYTKVEAIGISDTLYEIIKGRKPDSEDCCEDDCDEENGGVFRTSYGANFYHTAESTRSVLRDISRSVYTIRESLIGVAPTAEEKTAAVEANTSLTQCIVALNSEIDKAVRNMNDLRVDVQATLLGE